MNKYSLAQLAAIYTVYKDLDAGTRTVNCCTCGKSIYINQVEDCYNYYGHYIARSIEPKLKYHPFNAYAQCVKCNMQISQNIDDAYDKYIIRRYGKNFKQKLLDEPVRSDEFCLEFYKCELRRLSNKFPELKQVIENYDEQDNNQFITENLNDIEKQWNTYSSTYKQDLDELVRVLKTEPIEYERF